MQQTAFPTPTGTTVPSAGLAKALLESTDRKRAKVSPTLDSIRRKEFGQYMTPASVARGLAQMFGAFPLHVRLLDAGAGMGSLTAAFVEAATAADSPPLSIHVTAWEIDPVLAFELAATLAGCAVVCRAAGIKFSSTINRKDYLEAAAEMGPTNPPLYNCAILNPPYGKIASDSAARRALDHLGLSASNLYAAFVSLALTHTEAGGELVAVTPRSFCNGAMHRAYRSFVFRHAELAALHLHDSRRAAFSDDGILQEVVAFKLQKSRMQGPVALSSDSVDCRKVPFSDIVCPKDPQQVIRFPLDGVEVCRRMANLPCTLDDLGVSVSTGRVIEYRVKQHLQNSGGAQSVPLIHPQHLRDGGVHWPIEGFRKSNALADRDETRHLILPAGNYVVAKRVTAKEDAKRVQASHYRGPRVAFENHLNVFHAGGAGLAPALACGLLIFLNSDFVDSFIRMISGSTQINATDLHHLRYPSAQQLTALGEGMARGDPVLRLRPCDP